MSNMTLAYRKVKRVLISNQTSFEKIDEVLDKVKDEYGVTEQEIRDFFVEAACRGYMKV